MKPRKEEFHELISLAVFEHSQILYKQSVSLLFTFGFEQLFFLVIAHLSNNSMIVLSFIHLVA